MAVWVFYSDDGASPIHPPTPPKIKTNLRKLFLPKTDFRNFFPDYFARSDRTASCTREQETYTQRESRNEDYLPRYNNNLCVNIFQFSFTFESPNTTSLEHIYSIVDDDNNTSHVSSVSVTICLCAA